MCPFVEDNGKWKCELCQQVNHVRGLFICPPHGVHVEVGPQPDGVPRKIPCPGDPNPVCHQIDPSALTCIQCYDGQWFPWP